MCCFQTSKIQLQKHVLKQSKADLPGGPVVKNSPAKAGDMGSDPWPGKIPRAMEQLSLWLQLLQPKQL